MYFRKPKAFKSKAIWSGERFLHPCNSKQKSTWHNRRHKLSGEASIKAKTLTVYGSNNKNVKSWLIIYGGKKGYTQLFPKINGYDNDFGFQLLT